MLNSFISKGGKFIACRWRIALLILLVLCVVGIPGTWLLVERIYVTTGAIKIDVKGCIRPFCPESISVYQRFMYNQSEMVTSTQMVQRVADDLADKGLTFFEGRASGFIAKLRRRLNRNGVGPEPATVLKQAILDKTITAEPVLKEALIKISMRWTNSEEAKRIVDSFIRNYIVVTSATQEEEQLAVLKNEQKVLAGKLKSQLEKTKAIAQEFRSILILKDKRQEIKLEHVRMLLSKTTEWEVRIIHLEAQVEVLKDRLESRDGSKEEQTVEQNDPTRRVFINADPTLQALIQNLAVLEQELILAIQRGQNTNPETKNRVDVIEKLKGRIEQRKTKVGKMYDGFMANKIAETEKDRFFNVKKELANIQAEMEQANIFEKRFIEELQAELSLTQKMYSTICRRIQKMEMERKRPLRLSVAYNADVGHVSDVRWKYTIVLVLGAVVSTILLTLLKPLPDKK
jgi:hypothetical protein